jgi:hypothetical protein
MLPIPRRDNPGRLDIAVLTAPGHALARLDRHRGPGQRLDPAALRATNPFACWRRACPEPATGHEALALAEQNGYIPKADAGGTVVCPNARENRTARRQGAPRKAGTARPIGTEGSPPARSQRRPGILSEWPPNPHNSAKLFILADNGPPHRVVPSGLHLSECAGSRSDTEAAKRSGAGEKTGFAQS